MINKHIFLFGSIYNMTIYIRTKVLYIRFIINFFRVINIFHFKMDLMIMNLGYWNITSRFAWLVKKFKLIDNSLHYVAQTTSLFVRQKMSETIKSFLANLNTKSLWVLNLKETVPCQYFIFRLTFSSTSRAH